MYIIIIIIIIIIIHLCTLFLSKYYYYYYYYYYYCLLYQLPHDNVTALYFNIGRSSFLCIILRCTDCHVVCRF
jgi:hypothetical protein